MYKDVHVLEISNNKNTGKKDKNVRIKATLNINRFFPVYHKLNGSRGEVKGRRKCKTCLYICVLSPAHLWLIESPATSDGNSYTKWTTLITDELTTMRWHMQTYHAVITYPKHILLFLSNDVTTGALSKVVPDKGVSLHASWRFPEATEGCSYDSRAIHCWLAFPRCSKGLTIFRQFNEGGSNQMAYSDQPGMFY